jgi:hypothetical protein
MQTRLAVLAFSLTSFVLVAGPALAQAPATADAPASSKIWLERRAEFEEYLKTAEVVGMEEIKVGVTKPRKASLAPGGLVDAIAWKVVPPGRSTGYWESYKSEIAAYELDKMLGLDMVPPTVEKRVKGDLGAAVMWCSPVKSFKDMGGVPTPPGRYIAGWTRQLSRAKMFDNLIGNLDPNLGNWLVDPAWNLILIDHTRAFTSDKGMVHKKMDYIDGALWKKLEALTMEELEAKIGAWVGKGELRAMLQRRDAMVASYAKQAAANPDSVIK